MTDREEVRKCFRCAYQVDGAVRDDFEGENVSVHQAIADTGVDLGKVMLLSLYPLISLKEVVETDDSE